MSLSIGPEIELFIRRFLEKRGREIEGLRFEPLPADGSRRLFWRIHLADGGPTFVAMANPPADPTAKRENYAYLMIGSHLHRKGIPVPEIHSYVLDRGWFIMEDLGKTRLQDILASNQDPLPLYEQVLEHLFRLQLDGARDFDTGWCCQTERYDRTVMRRYESNYFREAFLSGYLGLKGELAGLDAPFNHLTETALKADGGFFLHRDFQSRNIIVSEGYIGIVDWQGGRLGPLGYDLASLLIDPYSDLSLEHRSELYERYVLMINDHNAGWTDSFRRYYPYLSIQRNLQILGAFSYLTKTMKKGHFEAYIPPALRNLKELLLRVSDPELSPLRDLVRDLRPPEKSLDRNDLVR
ncbi:MAG: phosphotransferase [Pseudomonadota bacterium]